MERRIKHKDKVCVEYFKVSKRYWSSNLQDKYISTINNMKVCLLEESKCLLRIDWFICKHENL